ncbi:MAG: hypothetical protein KAT35_00910, partial [Candidatus Aenigmarchaeota archaeon]|nr:hypothetical protein [Candidatus Aenigmarchaeota archaeon]
MVPKKASALVVAIFLLALASCRTTDIFAAVQTGHVLDLDGLDFPFNETYFNDSAESQEHDYTGAGSVAYGVSVPRNSTITAFEMNVTGKIQYIYSESINNPGLLGISIGNITTDTGNEMVTGGTKGEANVYALSGQDGSMLWTYNLSSQNNNIYSTDIGNVTNNPGNEIAFGAENSRVYVLNVDDSGATEAWNKLVTGFPQSVRIANVTVDSPNEVIAGASRVYIYNYTGGLVCNSSSFTVNSLAEGNLSDDAGLEIAVA